MAQKFKSPRMYNTESYTSSITNNLVRMFDQLGKEHGINFIDFYTASLSDQSGMIRDLKIKKILNDVSK